jgi:ankyrin repeat protein
LLEKGADVNAITVGNTVLKYAAYENYAEIAKLLIEKGANVNARDEWGQTALMSAADGNSIEVAKILIENGTLKGFGK